MCLFKIDFCSFLPPPTKNFYSAPLKQRNLNPGNFTWLVEWVECPEGRGTHKHATGVSNAVLTF